MVKLCVKANRNPTAAKTDFFVCQVEEFQEARGDTLRLDSTKLLSCSIYCCTYNYLKNSLVFVVIFVIELLFYGI